MIEQPVINQNVEGASICMRVPYIFSFREGSAQDGLLPAFFLQLERNFFRALPFKPFVSAC
jgi:hypothetical protein